MANNQLYKSTKFEQEPFWGGDQDIDSIADIPPSKHRRYRNFSIHFCLILLYSIASLVFINKHEYQNPSGYNVFAHKNLKYEPKLFFDLNGGGFAGGPSPEVDKSWHILLQNMSIRVSDSELARNNQTSVELPDGGNLAWLEVFHSLHCLKWLRQWNYRRYYHPDMPASYIKHMEDHADHCIERLRQAVMCLPDLSITTFKWTDNDTNPMLNTYKAPHMCADWDDLMLSMEDRLVDTSEIDAMVNPLLVVEN